MNDKKILDACCGSRMWHFNKDNIDVLYMDNRELESTLSDGRILRVAPEIVGDFRRMIFRDESFSLVLFDPPHLLKAGKSSWLRTKYGILGDNWKEDIRDGLTECWRVLKPNGTMIFKWNEEQVSFKDIKPLLPCKPIVGQRRGKTIFLVFFKSIKSVDLY